MGNASGREGGDGDEDGGDGEGYDDGEEPSVGSSSYSNRARHNRSDDALVPRDSPPASPRFLLSPRMFAPQMPIPPLEKSLESLFHQMRINEQEEDSDIPLGRPIPVLLVWTLGGSKVSVEGSWDHWKTRTALQNSGKDFSILLSLPSGVYRYRFIVDGMQRFIPDLPFETDRTGYNVNILDVQDYVPENVDSMSENEPPPSPDSSYSCLLPDDKELAKDPPALPPLLLLGILGTHEPEEEDCQKPQHTVLNHLFIEKGWGSQPLVALSLTHRFQKKYVTLVLYKPL